MISKSKGKKFADDDEKQYTPYKRIKVQFATDFDRDASPESIRPITTQLYVGSNVQPKETSTVEEIEKYFRWRCTAQFALTMSKFWIQTSNEERCGIGLKCKQIGIIKMAEERQKPSAQLNRSLFAKPMGGSMTVKPQVKPKVQAKKQVVEEEDEENEETPQAETAENNEDDGSDSEPETPPPKKTSVKVTSKQSPQKASGGKTAKRN